MAYTLVEINEIHNSKTGIYKKIYDVRGGFKWIGNPDGSLKQYTGKDPFTQKEDIEWLMSEILRKQDFLVSGENIKTINGQSLLGDGNITISGGGGTWGSITGNITDQTDLISYVDSNYVSLSDSYSDPSFIFDLSWSKITGAPAFITGITGSDVTTALGYTPYNATNPAGYITSAALSPYLTSLDAAFTYVALAGSYSNPSWITALAWSKITGTPTSLSGYSITGTKSNFDTACTDGNFLYVGDVTQYTDEMSQDAVGAMVDSTLVYVDATPLLTRAALSGDVSAPQGSNTVTLSDEFQLAMISNFRFLTNN